MNEAVQKGGVSSAYQPAEVNKKLADYYNRMDGMYELLWGNKTLGYHLGFWEEGVKNHHQAILLENRRVAEALHLDKADHVLDAGCGICGTALWMAENYGCKVTGITLTGQQVTRAGHHATKKNLDKLVKAEIMDFCKMSFPGETFTKVFGIESICCGYSKQAFVEEAFRVLKPGGRLVVADGFIPTKNMKPADEKIYREFCDGLGLPDLAVIDDFKGYLEAAGFTDIKVEDRTKDVLPSARMIKRLNIPFYPPYYAICKLRLMPKLYLDDVVACLRQYDVLAQGVGKYILFSAEKPANR